MKSVKKFVLFTIAVGLAGGGCGEKNYNEQYSEDTYVDTEFVDPFSPHWAPWDRAVVDTDNCPWPESISSPHAAGLTPECIPRCDENNICWLGSVDEEIESMQVFDDWLIYRQRISPGEAEILGTSDIIWQYNTQTLAHSIVHDHATNVRTLGVLDGDAVVLIDENSEPYTTMLVDPDGAIASKPLPVDFSRDGILFSDGWLYSPGNTPLASTEAGSGVQRMRMDSDAPPGMVITNAALLEAVALDVPGADWSKEFFPAEIVAARNNVLWVRGRQFVCVTSLPFSADELHCTWLDPENGWIGAAGDEYLLFISDTVVNQHPYIATMHTLGEIGGAAYPLRYKPNFIDGALFYFGGWFYLPDPSGIVGIRPRGLASPEEYLAMRADAHYYPYRYWMQAVGGALQIAGINQRGMVVHHGIYDYHSEFYNTVLISIPLLPCAIAASCPENFTCSTVGYCELNN
ncbi:MAG: hypothetical protein JXX14_06495 [Deltaproteobacteria bacterium]|nr:hypothetical protein [Deltaproteobacteria bacterium]